MVSEMVGFFEQYELIKTVSLVFAYKLVLFDCFWSHKVNVGRPSKTRDGKLKEIYVANVGYLFVAYYITNKDSGLSSRIRQRSQRNLSDLLFI